MKRTTEAAQRTEPPVAAEARVTDSAVLRRHFLIPDLEQLRRDVASARGLERVNIDRLYRCLEPDPNRPPRDAYDMHWVLIHLLRGDDESASKAREALLAELYDGGPPCRPGHSWNEPEFFRCHMWISAAMAAHLAIAADWLACEKVLDAHEIRAAGARLVEAFWEHLYPHMKGHSSYYAPPINQDTALAAGCLVIGHLFGTKWASDSRARRMYTDALTYIGDIFATMPSGGYDNDGFTYMRLIQSPLVSLIAMVFEATQGRDIYFTEFGPDGWSIAGFMEELYRCTLPSGYSFPHGRYGYVRDWCQYGQAYASRKTGDPRYLELALTTDQSTFIAPWIAMDLPLAVVLAPYGSAPGAPDERREPEYASWHSPRLWSNLGMPRPRIQAHLSWRPSAHGTFMLEHDGCRFVMIAGETAAKANGFCFEGIAGTGRGGRGYRHIGNGSIILDSVQLRDQWAAGALLDYTKALAICDGGLAVSIDRYAAPAALRAGYGLSLSSPIAGGMVEDEDGKRRMAIACTHTLEARGRETAHQSDQKGCVKGNPARMTRHTAALQPGSQGLVVTVYGFDGRTPEGLRLSGDEVRWHVDGRTYDLIVNQSYPGPTGVPGTQTDARLTLATDRSLVLTDVRRYHTESRRLWTTNRTDVAVDDRSLTLKRLAFGGYARYDANDAHLRLQHGGGYSIYATVERPFDLILPSPGDTAFVQVNGVQAGVEPVENLMVRVAVPATPRNFVPPAVAALENHHELGVNAILTGLDELLRGFHVRCLHYARALLLHEHKHVRLTAAEVLGYLGTEDDATLIADRLLEESELTSPLNGTGAPWHGKWKYFSSSALMADALRRLGTPSVLQPLRQALARHHEPHARGAIELAIRTLEETA